MSSKQPPVLLPVSASPVVGLAAEIFSGTERESARPGKRVYIALDDHTDYMWSGNEETYRQAFLEMLDFYLDQADATAGLPAHQQSRFNCDGSIWMWTYQRDKSEQEFERLLQRVRSGHITMPLTAAVCCYGAMPAEAVLRSMFFAGALERRHRIRFPMAHAMEDQTLGCGLTSLFAGSGAKYCWHGICDCATPVLGRFNDREHPLYWWTGPDGSRLLMKWYPLLLDDNKWFGGYAEARYPAAAIEVTESKRFKKRIPYPVIGIFGHGWDDLKTLSTEFPKVARELSNAERQVIVSNEVDFFEDVEQSFGEELPAQSCSFGNDWDLHSATLAEDTSRIRRAVEKLRASEALATLVSLQEPDSLPGRSEARDQAWMNLGLYYEHNWIANHKIPPEERTAWQRRLATEVEGYVNGLHTDAAAALGRLIRREGPHPRFFAFNPLGWPRTDVAELPLSGSAPVHVIDLSTGAEAPSQRVTSDGAQFLRILAADVPSVGYKVFEVRPGRGHAFTPAATVQDGVIENRFYRLTVSGRGAITSLVDKQRGEKELVQEIDGRVANDLGDGEGALAVEETGPVSVTLRANATGPLQHTSRITLLRDSRRIAIRNDIEQNFDAPHDWSFAFRLERPELWHEEVGAVLRAKLLADGGHYSPRNARYDWLSLNHYADLSDGALGVTLSNADCSFMRLGRSTMTDLDTATPQLSVLAGGNVSGVKLRITNQAGSTHFRQRFALQTHDAFDPVESMRFALEHQNPLVTGLIAGGTPYPEQSYSLLQISHPEIFVWSVKPAEEGIAQGVMVRVWNIAHRPVDGALVFARPLAKATRTTHIETDLEPVPLVNGQLPLALAGQQIKTFRFVARTRE